MLATTGLSVERRLTSTETLSVLFFNPGNKPLDSTHDLSRILASSFETLLSSLPNGPNSFQDLDHSSILMTAKGLPRSNWQKKELDEPWIEHGTLCNVYVMQSRNHNH